MSEGGYVLDSSAVLAVIFEEPGAENVYPILERASISAVNLSEVVTKLVEREGTDEDISADLNDLKLNVVSFESDQAVTAGLLRRTTRVRGLSFGDRACLALAAAEQATVVTTDRAWAELDLPVPVLLLR